MKLYYCAFELVIFLIIVLGCQPQSRYIKIKGSETVLPISLKLAEEFGKVPRLPGISVTAGGSGVGIAALLEKNADIAMSSREIKFEEKLKFKDRKVAYCEKIIGYDALAIVTHPSNPVDSISLRQLKLIFQDSIQYWSEVGGHKQKIVAFNRESSSGTYEFFKNVVLKKQKFGKLETVGANGELVEKIAANPRSIGYVGIAYLNPKVKTLKVYERAGEPAAAPTIENTMKGIYPLVRPLYFYYLCEREKELAPVLDFITSIKGQEMVKSVGYPPNKQYYPIANK
ncbi:MAG: phosphate ABC transporter substrate-binding protein [Bacteroidia bacterium]|nr:phosphate ABC transporter substrate-binding protein [Bacteroidia bacterium]MDW8157395.1 phosphate ABC transporter substrate-binding protein [Bacteroidia bacterium]